MALTDAEALKMDRSAAADVLCGCAQSVEEPGLYSGADWISNIYERKNSKAKRGQQISPFPCGQFPPLVSILHGLRALVG